VHCRGAYPCVAAGRVPNMSTDAFRVAMQARGLKPPAQIEPGKLQRCASSQRAGDAAGWCKLFDDQRGGVFGDWREGWQETWQAEHDRQMSAVERETFRTQTQQAAQQREAETRAEHAAAVKRGATLWQMAGAAPADHPYLIGKGIKPHGLRVKDGALLVPVRGGGDLLSLQFIAADGGKRFLTGGRVAGGYHSIGKPDGVLCICEGFATGASIHEATGIAVAVAFNAGNLLLVAQVMRDKFPALRLILCADDDAGTIGNPGLSKARAAAEAIAGQLAVPEFGTNRPKGATDFNDLAQHAGADAVRACIERAESLAKIASLAAVSGPEPLRRPVPPPQPYPLAELGNILAPAAQAMRRVIQAPDAICGASVLAAASLAAQALADVEIDGRTLPLSLWLLSVAESGERKSAVDTEVMRAAREHERELAHQYEFDAVAHAAALAEWQARVECAKTAAKKAKGKGLAYAMESIGPQPPAPILPRVTAADFTAEGLYKLLAGALPSVGAFTDEAALVFGGHGMNDEAIRRTAGTLSKLWDRGELDRVRVADGATKLHGRRFAMHLMAQPVIAERALSDDVLAGQGFLARCLLAWPQSTAGTRHYVAESLRDDPDMQHFMARLGELHRAPLPLAEGQRQELAPRRLYLTAGAKAAWVALHEGIEAGMAPAGKFATVKPWASKAPEQALRIAGVLTLLDDPAAQSIDAATLNRAAELALWHLCEAVRLVGMTEVSAQVRDAEALLAWCHEKGLTLMHSRDALRNGPARIRERDAFIAAVETLERAGWAERLGVGAVVDGKHRRNAWRIVAAADGEQ
jgi:phage/plasmid primase-like uncharacterized protein